MAEAHELLEFNKLSEELKSAYAKQGESFESLRADLNDRFTELRNLIAELRPNPQKQLMGHASSSSAVYTSHQFTTPEATMTSFLSQTPTPPIKPPDPPEKEDITATNMIQEEESTTEKTLRLNQETKVFPSVEVPISDLEHMKNPILQSHECVELDEFGIANKISDPICRELIVCDVDLYAKEVKVLSQQSSHDDDNHVEHQVFDEITLRVTSDEKQRKSLKTWKFKFKTKDFNGVVPHVGEYKLMERKSFIHKNQAKRRDVVDGVDFGAIGDVEKTEDILLLEAQNTHVCYGFDPMSEISFPCHGGDTYDVSNLLKKLGNIKEKLKMDFIQYKTVMEFLQVAEDFILAAIIKHKDIKTASVLLVLRGKCKFKHLTMAYGDKQGITCLKLGMSIDAFEKFRKRKLRLACLKHDSADGVKEIFLVCLDKKWLFIVVIVLSATDEVMTFGKESSLPPKSIKEVENKVVETTNVKQCLENYQGGFPLEFLKIYEALVDMVMVPYYNTMFINYPSYFGKHFLNSMKRAEDDLKRVKIFKFTNEQSAKLLVIIISYGMFNSPRPPEFTCCQGETKSSATETALFEISNQIKRHEESFIMVLLIIAGNLLLLSATHILVAENHSAGFKEVQKISLTREASQFYLQMLHHAFGRKELQIVDSLAGFSTCEVFHIQRPPEIAEPKL